MNQTTYSAISMNTSNISNLTDDESRFNDSNIEETIATGNKLITLTHQALGLLAQKRLADAAEVFRSIIDLLQRSEESPIQVNYQISLMQCNLAACYFFQDDLEATQKALNQASATLNIEVNFSNELYRRLYLKILCHFIILFVKCKDKPNVQAALDLVKQFFANEKNARKRAQYAIHVIYLLYHTDSLIGYSGWQYESDEESLSPDSQGMLLMIKAMNFLFAKQHEQATDLFFEANAVWERLADYPMRLIITRQLIYIHQNQNDAYQKLLNYYNGLLDESGLDESSLRGVFDSFDEKIEIIKELSKFFMDLENVNWTSISNLRYEMDTTAIKLWARLALKYNIAMINRTKQEARIKKSNPTHNSDFGGQNLQQKRNGNPAQNPKIYQSEFQRPTSIDKRRDANIPISRSVDRYRSLIASPMFNDVLRNLHQTLNMIQKEESFQVLESLAEHPFFKNFKKQVNSAFYSLDNKIAKTLTAYAMQKIRATVRTRIPDVPLPNYPNTKTAPSFTGPIRNSNTSIPTPKPVQPYGSPSFGQGPNNLSLKARQFVTTGGFLLKLNLTSSGQMNKFMKVINNDTIRWGKKENYLRNSKTCHSYLLSEVWGLLYGKCTKTFKRSINRDLEPWLCFSLIFKKRSVDFYCTEDTINYWYIGLAELVKQNRSDHAFVLSKGQFFWRKLKMVMIAVATMEIPKETLKKAKRNLSFCKAVRLCGIKFKEKGLI
jgi:hypothetical protein